MREFLKGMALPMHSVSSSMVGESLCFCLDFRLTEKSNRPVVTLLPMTNQSSSNEIRAAKTLFIFDTEIEKLFATTPEISKLGCFVDFGREFCLMDSG